MIAGTSNAESEARQQQCPECGTAFVADFTRPPSTSPCPACGSLRWVAEALLRHVDAVTSETVPLILLSGRDKSAALRTLVASALEQGGIDLAHESTIYQAILEREALGPTAIGRGFAFPHARFASGVSISLAIGLSSEGIDFESLDGKPVHTITLLISPLDDPGVHLRTLERISRNLRQLV